MTAVVTLATDRDPWEAQPKEKPKARAAFERWMNWPTRPRPTWAEFAVATGENLQTVRTRAQRWRWMERALARDEMVEKEVWLPAVIEKTRDLAYDFVEKRNKHMVAVEGIIDVELRKLLHEANNEDKPVVGTKTLLEMMKLWLAMHATLPEDPQDATPDDGGLSNLESADLRQLRALVLKANAGKG